MHVERPGKVQQDLFIILVPLQQGRVYVSRFRPAFCLRVLARLLAKSLRFVDNVGCNAAIQVIVPPT